jgi:hypothetical protein
MNEVLTRKSATLAGLFRYYTGRMCRNGHDAQRYTSNGCCVECCKPVRYKRKMLSPPDRTVRLVLRVPHDSTDDHVRRLSLWIARECVPAFFKAEYDRAMKDAGLSTA